MTSPDRSSALNRQLSTALTAHRNGDLDKAEAGYRAILRTQARHFDATQLLGVLLSARGKYKEAGTLLRRAIAINPNAPMLHNNLASVSQALGQREDAVQSLTRAVELDPNYVDAIANRGSLLLDLGRTREALADFDRALALNPVHVMALQKSARILAIAGQRDLAVDRNAKALGACEPTAEMQLRSGMVLFHCKHMAESIAAYDRALALQPDFLQAMINRAAVFETVGHLEEAAQQLDQALGLYPRHPGLLYNKATVLKLLGRVDEACALYREALTLAPNDPDAATHYGMALLLLGDYAQGWPLLETRWRREANAGKQPALSPPAWQGQSLEGRSIVVYSEQGLGDIVQFSRYLALLQQRGARVSFLVALNMHRLLRSAFPDVTLLGSVAEAVAQNFDFKIAMMSLPLLFDTTVDTFPAHVPYLRPEAERVAHWRARIGDAGFKIGISWQGKSDVTADATRSFPLGMLASLQAVPGVRLISLQKGEGLEQLESCGFAVETLGAEFDSGDAAFVDTAAVVACVDLVISPDTSIAHVAGALGRETWLPLKRVPDWRWLLGRDDSPWYPTMRLFRQTKAGDWSDVFASMRDALIRRAASQSTSEISA
ncbi:MAG TPA: tetratricopeptide repeat protein [Rhizomicrobium sp.]|nr:tetratricopeptide repeat protein [Rhizomicrobium sp.]